MHFDQRTQDALRSVGLSTDEIQQAAAHAVQATEETAQAVESFFDRETVYSDMDRAHSSSEIQEHTVDYVDCFTHAADVRGYLRFDSWGVPIEGARTLDDGTLELTLGSTVGGRVRFATTKDAL